MAFVGRTAVLSRLLRTIEHAGTGRASLVLVSGEAGIGKTTLVSEAAAHSGWRLGWGTCVEAESAPAFWPWTVALRDLIAKVPAAPEVPPVGGDVDELARLLPERGGAHRDQSGPDVDTQAARLRLFDAVARWLERAARDAPVLLVLDDLQWADPSTLELLQFVARPYRPVPLAVVAAYRHDELEAGTARHLAELGTLGESVRLHGLSRDDVVDLVTDAAGPAVADRWAAEVHRRTDGHPFLARQLSHLLAEPDRPSGAVPEATLELVARRVQRLTPGAREFVEAAAVAGNELIPDVLAAVCGTDAAGAAVLTEEGVATGVLVRGHGTTFAHDLFREGITASLPVDQRMVLHQRLADALERRHARGAAVVAADVARHCVAAVPLEGGERAVRWAGAAADDERGRLAFGEAAAHLARARRALEDAGQADVGPVLVDLLLDEADARARSGDPAAARALLDDAWQRAARSSDAERLGRIALGFQRLGARFAMPREAVVETLEQARTAVHGTGTALEAQLTAGLARELHHSVPAERARARPLSERALELARPLDDPGTLATCLLARHDVLWTPGRSGERIDIAREIAGLARRSGDSELYATGLLLTANALLEEGSAAFRTVLTEFLSAADAFGEPRHDYLARTRRAALALLDGRLGEAEQLVDEASALGERIGEPDTGNVRMSQRLGLVRATGDPARLRATAAEAIRWWVGVPSHAHAVAAGLFALAGEPADLAASRRALDTVVDLDTWRDDRSYLWPVFVGGMATAASRLQDRRLCADLLAEIEPVGGTCGVNGALVCFMGSNAQWAGVLAAALGRTGDARHWLEKALAVHERLGAVAWEYESCRELAALGDARRGVRAGVLAAALGRPDRETSGEARKAGSAAAAAGRDGTDAELSRADQLWRVRHQDASVYLRNLKGLSDLAVLLGRPGVDVHVLALVGAEAHDGEGGPLLDPVARTAYRRRLAEIDESLAEAHFDHDLGQAERLDSEKAALLAELGRAAGLAGRTRGLGTSTTERARKAVTSRLREAITRIAAVLPELGAHLDRSVRTGTTCSYQPTEPLTWTLGRLPDGQSARNGPAR